MTSTPPLRDVNRPTPTPQHTASRHQTSAGALALLALAAGAWLAAARAIVEGIAGRSPWWAVGLLLGATAAALGVVAWIGQQATARLLRQATSSLLGVL